MTKVLIKKLYLIFSLLALTASWNLEIPKRAFRLYQRGKLSKAAEALDHSIAKDTLNPAAYYLYSLLYTDTAYAPYNMDTAYAYINKAIEQFSLITDPEEIEDLDDLSVDSTHLVLQKQRIDSLKFIDIKATHALEAYNDFIRVHVGAFQMSEAVALRNHIAFQKATEKNTWGEYEQFMQAYPEAEDFVEAKKRYEKLIYEEKTAEGSYQSLIRFLEDFPNTPYREIVEAGIFHYATASNTLETFVAFLLRYPNKKLAKILNDRAYHIYKAHYPAQAFFEDFDFGVNVDSLKNVSALEGTYWLPKPENNRITFTNLNGATQLQTPFEALPDSHRCAPVANDFIYGKSEHQNIILGKNGQQIYKGVFDEAIDAGYGFIIIRNVAGDQLIHKSGEIIIDLPVEEVKVLDNRFIRTKKKDFYGLESINGVPYLNHEFTAIDTFKTYLRLEKKEGIQLIAPETLKTALTGTPIPFEAQYDELKALPNGRIWVRRNNEEAILDQQLNVIIPFGKYGIYERPYGWKLESNQGIKLIHDRYKELLKDHLFDKVVENDQWLALQKGNTWALLDQIGEIPARDGLDSVAFWGEHMAMLFKKDAVWTQFRNGKQLLIKKGWQPKLLIPQSYISSGEKPIHDFFMLSNAKKFRKVYNDQGREILAATYKDVVALGPDMLRLQKRNAALADSTGHLLLNFIYDGIGSSHKGYASLLKKGEFGLINPSLGIHISPAYERRLEPYNDTILVASDGRYKGFINTQNKSLTAFDFDEVTFYSDSIALTRIENEWLFYDIANDEPLYEGIIDYFQQESGVFLITKETGKGIFSPEYGELIEPTYTDIKQLKIPEKPIYFAMKLVEEADIYVVIYFDAKGNKLFTQTFQKEEYFKVICPSD